VSAAISVVAKAGASAAADTDAADPDMGDKDHATQSTVVDRSVEFGAASFSDLQVVLYAMQQLYGMCQSKKASVPGSAVPHRNFISMDASGSGSRIVYSANIKDRRLFTAALATLLCVIDSGQAAVDMGENVKDDGGGGGGGGAPDGGDAARTVKKLALARQGTTDVLNALTSMLNTFQVISQEDKLNTASKGINIENTDGYAVLKSRTLTTLSSNAGPAVLESSSDRIGSLVNKNIYEDHVPGHLAQPELSPHEGGPFQESQAVLLRSPLVKAVAEELSFESSHQVMKAEDEIQLIIGLPEAPEAAADAALAAYKAQTADIEAADLAAFAVEQAAAQSVEGPSAPVPSPPAGRALKASQIAEDKVDVPLSEGSKQLLVQMRSAGARLSFVTKKGTSEVSLTQGSSAGAGASSLSLDSGRIVLSAKEGQRLQLIRDPRSATLSVSESASLSIDPGGAKLSAGEGSISLAPAGARLTHTASSKLACGESSMEITPALISIKTTVAAVDADLADLGS
jgi:hypothetical protein